MPLIFDYQCKECGTIREILVLSKDKDQHIRCSKCDSEMQKLMPAPGLLVTNFHDKPAPKRR